MVLANGGDMALYRTRQANAERLHRELERQLPRRMLQRYAVLDPIRGKTLHQIMDGGLQSTTPTFGFRQHHARRVRHQIHTGEAGRLRPQTKLRTISKTGGEPSLRSQRQYLFTLRSSPASLTIQSTG